MSSSSPIVSADIYEHPNLVLAREGYKTLHPGIRKEYNTQYYDREMGALLDAATDTELPPGTKLGHLDELVSDLGFSTNISAQIFSADIINNPLEQNFAKALELALAVLRTKSPETWQHIRRHTAFTMLYYEKQEGLMDGAPDEVMRKMTPEKRQELLTLLIAALGHDIGKIGIHPELLHKERRLPKERVDAMKAFYVSNVPATKEIVAPDGTKTSVKNPRAHDSMFLDCLNEARLSMAPIDGAAPAAHDVTAKIIMDLGGDPLKGEPTLVDDGQKKIHAEIWLRILANAKQYLSRAAWFTPEEEAILAMPSRGTLTEKEREVVVVHDYMSHAFFKKLQLPHGTERVKDLVSMERFRHEGQYENADPLQKIIHATDCFEALTANRSYRPAYRADQAITIMEAEKSIDKALVKNIRSMVEDGTIEMFTDNPRLKPGSQVTAAVEWSTQDLTALLTGPA